MTTPKKPLHTTSHKHPGTKPDAKPSQGSAFDIIPRSQIRPSVTARPVLTPTRPEQADNTLQTATQAASSQLRHQSLSLDTPSAPELPQDDAEALMDKVTAITSAAVRPKLQLRPRSQLKVDDTPQEVHPDTHPDEPKLEPVADVGPPADSAEKPDEQPAEEQPTGLQEEPVEEPAKDAQEPKAELVTDEATDSAVAEDSGNLTSQTKEADKTDEPDANKPDTSEPTEGSIDHIFKTDDAQPIEHSQALKDELQTMDGKEGDDADGDKDEDPGPHHHELYGGKPVIVIHKAHGAKTALKWLLWLLFCLILALAIVDVLLDAGVIDTDYNVPHTHYLK